MKGINQQITLNTDTNVGLAPLGQITHLMITCHTGGTLYVLVDVPDSAAPSATNAYFTVPNGESKQFEFDNAAQAPGTLRVRTGVTGYIHLLGW